MLRPKGKLAKSKVKRVGPCTNICNLKKIKSKMHGDKVKNTSKQFYVIIQDISAASGAIRDYLTDNKECHKTPVSLADYSYFSFSPSEVDLY